MRSRALILTVTLAACAENQSVVGGVVDAAAPDRPDVTGAPDATDVPPPQDVTDASMQDAPTRCASAADCVGHPEGPACDQASGRCVPCTAADDRCPAGQYCDATANRCAAGCRDDASCGAAAGDGGATSGRCDTATRQCVACLRDEHCPPGNLCVGNLCVTGCSATQACPAGQTCCGGACVDPQTSTAHCGGCGMNCAVPNAAPACANGTCAVGACTGAFADCDRAAANGCETDTRADVAHCGACGNACATRPHTASSCEGGACRYACEAGFADCDGDPANGCEVDTRASTAHCGACGRACALPNATASCAMGACAVARCEGSFADCDGVASNGCETDTRASVAHCGACGSACPARPNGASVCAAGRCAVTCVAGFAECDGDPLNGCEVDVTRDVAHCGGCGRRCALPNATASCAMASCAVSACTGSFRDCDGDASNGCEVDVQTSRAHCGACGRRCAAGQVCSAGACVGEDGPLTVAAGTRREFETLSVAGQVTAIAGATLSTAEARSFRAGQEALLINLQGSRVDTIAVGRREFVEIAAVRDGALDLTRAPSLGYGAGGANTSLAGQRVFLVRVPHFTTVTLDGTLTARPWNGTVEGLGLIAFRASGAVTVGASGVIDATALGYRSQGHSCNGVTGLPGESIAPWPTIVPNDCYYEPPSRDANHGGGGGGLSDCNRYTCTTQLIGASGGGGGYGAVGLVGANNGTLHRGGAPGGVYGSANLEGWFLGSGGGAGAGGVSGPGNGTRGGNGGGMVFVQAPTLTVRGRVVADGQPGGDNANCTLGRGSGSGGGGSGGSVYLSAASLSLSGGTVRARGAAGGCLGGGAGGDGRVRVDCDTLDGASCAGLGVAPTSPPAFVSRP